MISQDHVVAEMKIESSRIRCEDYYGRIYLRACRCDIQREKPDITSYSQDSIEDCFPTRSADRAVGGKTYLLLHGNDRFRCWKDATRLNKKPCSQLDLFAGRPRISCQ